MYCTERSLSRRFRWIARSFERERRGRAGLISQRLEHLSPDSCVARRVSKDPSAERISLRRRYPMTTRHSVGGGVMETSLVEVVNLGSAD